MVKSWKLFLESSVSKNTTFRNVSIDNYQPGLLPEIDEIATICKEYNITTWSINKGLVDVVGDVILEKRGLSKIPLRFGKVSGGFYCYDNKLTSLDGSPREVGNFWCYNNELVSLKGGPEIVNGDFYCDNNKLSSLDGCPFYINGGLFCRNNADLISLEGLFSARIFLCDRKYVSEIGNIMISNKISFLEAIMIHIKEIPDNELVLILKTISPQKILDQNNFRVFNMIRTQLPEKWAEVMKLRNVDLSADLGELGF